MPEAVSRLTRTREAVSCTHPRNQTLVETGDTSAGPDGAERLGHGLATVGSHLGLEHLERLPESCDFEHVHGGTCAG